MRDEGGHVVERGRFVVHDHEACPVPEGDLGLVVPARSPEALASAILESLQAKPDPAAIRRRIEESFSVEQLLDNTEKVLWAAG